MPGNTYTPTQKAEALATLQENFGDIELTSRQLIIPQRTLRHWRAESKMSSDTPSALPKNISAAMPPAANAAEAANQFELLREKLMRQIFTLVEEVSDKPGDASFRAIAIARLLDRVHKLDTLIPTLRPEKQEYVYRVEYLYPDGSIHNKPPWASPTPDDPTTWEPVYPDL